MKDDDRRTNDLPSITRIHPTNQPVHSPNISKPHPAVSPLSLCYPELVYTREVIPCSTPAPR